MLTEPLPRALDIRKAAARGVSISGTLNPALLPRFKGLLASETGSISADFAFSKDEENRPLVRVHLVADVEVTCQRCLGPMPLAITGESTLAVVWTDEQASHLPRHLEPLIVAEEGCNLWDLVEDELMLAMPPFSYHATTDCNETMSGFAGPGDEAADPQRPNPFDVLAQLKTDD